MRLKNLQENLEEANYMADFVDSILRILGLIYIIYLLAYAIGFRFHKNFNARKLSLKEDEEFKSYILRKIK